MCTYGFTVYTITSGCDVVRAECLVYGGPEGSLPIAFLFKRFLCLSDLFQRFVSAILFRRFVSSICFSDFVSSISIFVFNDHYISIT